MKEVSERMMYMIKNGGNKKQKVTFRHQKGPNIVGTKSYDFMKVIPTTFTCKTLVDSCLVKREKGEGTLLLKNR